MVLASNRHRAISVTITIQITSLPAVSEARFGIVIAPLDVTNAN
jgi:hypothetical protein